MLSSGVEKSSVVEKSSGVEEYGDAFAFVEANKKFGNEISYCLRKVVENGQISKYFLDAFVLDKWCTEYNRILKYVLLSKDGVSKAAGNSFLVKGIEVEIFANPLDLTILSVDTPACFTIIDETGKKEGIDGVQGVLTHLGL